MNKTIMYAIETETGHIISRVGSEIAIPVLQYDDMQPENNFQTEYKLEKMPVFAIAGSHNNYKWTVKVPLKLKNKHRVFWGMKPLKRRANSHEMTVGWKGLKFKHGGHTFTVVKVKPDVSNSFFDAVVLKDEQKRQMEWNFGGMKVWLEENPESVIKADDSI